MALAAAGGCRGRPPARRLDRVSVAETDALRRLSARGVSADDLRGLAAGALGGAPRLAAGDGPADAAHFLARVAVQQADVAAGDARGPAAARVVLTVELAPAEEGAAIRESGAATQRVAEAGGDPDAAVREAVAKALAAAARSIALQLDALDKSDRALVRDLSGADADVRDHAVRVLAERRNPAAVPPLLERLRDPDPDVAERAVGALAELRDPRAVGPLIDRAHRRGGAAVASYARIVGDIGGPEARAWLETLAAGHPDPEVRAAAQESLATLRTAAAAPAAR